MKTTDGASIMGSYPYPPNRMIEMDYEFILIFKKPGNNISVPSDVKKESALSRDEWISYFTGHWTFGSTKQIEHKAMFPEELPPRLIKMFSFAGDTVLDPFLSSGTTAKVANELQRNFVGYEINESYITAIRDKINNVNDLFSEKNIDIIRRAFIAIPDGIIYKPSMKDAEQKIEPIDGSAALK